MRPTRRQFVHGIGAVGLGLVAGCGPWPGQAPPCRPAPVRLPRIGYLSASNPSVSAPLLDGLRQGLAQFGYAEGHNLLVEYRFADGQDGRLPSLAAELVELSVDII